MSIIHPEWWVIPVDTQFSNPKKLEIQVIWSPIWEQLFGARQDFEDLKDAYFAWDFISPVDDKMEELSVSDVLKSVFSFQHWPKAVSDMVMRIWKNNPKVWRKLQELARSIARESASDFFWEYVTLEPDSKETISSIRNRTEQLF